MTTKWSATRFNQCGRVGESGLWVSAVELQRKAVQLRTMAVELRSDCGMRCLSTRMVCSPRVSQLVYINSRALIDLGFMKGSWVCEHFHLTGEITIAAWPRRKFDAREDPQQPWNFEPRSRDSRMRLASKGIGAIHANELGT
jgi:hypothetical protein